MSLRPSFKSAFCPDGDALVTRSLLYREFLAEREEILRHKWFQSEKAGHDIGFENALVKLGGASQGPMAEGEATTVPSRGGGTVICISVEWGGSVRDIVGGDSRRFNEE